MNTQKEFGMKRRILAFLRSETGIIALTALVAFPSLAFVSAPLWSGRAQQSVMAPGDSISGTFASSTAAQISSDLLVRVGTSVVVTLTAATASSTAIILENRLNAGAWNPIKTYSTASSVNDTLTNDSPGTWFLRLRANTIPTADTVTYVLSKVISSRTVQEWFNNNGKSVLRITDVGIVSPKLTGTADSATGATRAQKLTTARAIYGNSFDGTAALTGAITITSLTATASSTPASNAACTAGTLAWDSGFIYVCTASAAWKRAALTGGY